MQQSMTGFGRDERSCGDLSITSEVKTLNSKFLDFSPRLSKELSHKEAEIRTLVADQLKRGKVMLTIELEMNKDTSNAVQVNEELFRAYHDKFLALSQSVDSSSEDLFKLAIESPDVIAQQGITADEIPWEDIRSSIASAIHSCIAFREDEGNTLVKKLKDYINNIKIGLSEIQSLDEGRSESIRERLLKSIDEIRDKVTVDENRFEQELIFYLERLDISEEKVRLGQHLNYFEKVIQHEEFAGKKLGFIAQEIGREINTIGSKANNAEIQRAVVQMKDELEKIKEQTLNLM